MLCSVQDCRSWGRHNHAEPGPGTQATQVRGQADGSPSFSCYEEQQGEEGFALARKRPSGSTCRSMHYSFARICAPVKSRQVML